MRCALVDGRGRILYQERGKTEIAGGYQSFIDRLLNVICTVAAAANKNDVTVAAIGVGMPGIISPDGQVHSSVNLRALDDVNLRDVISSAVGLPVAVLNDANAYAFGEKRFGAGKPFASLLVATLGTGVGGGLILGNRLWSGIDGAAAEFGHITMEPEGLPCPCGNRGCLEQYASATALAASARRKVTEWSGQGMGPHSVHFSAHGLALAARDGDTLALNIFAEAGRYLGIAAAGLANLLNLEAFIIGGGVAESFDLLEPAVRAEIDQRTFPVNGARLKVLKGTLGDDAGILGSAAMALKLVRTADRL